MWDRHAKWPRDSPSPLRPAAYNSSSVNGKASKKMLVSGIDEGKVALTWGIHVRRCCFQVPADPARIRPYDHWSFKRSELASFVDLRRKQDIDPVSRYPLYLYCLPVAKLGRSFCWNNEIAWPSFWLTSKSSCPTSSWTVWLPRLQKVGRSSNEQLHVNQRHSLITMKKLADGRSKADIDDGIKDFRIQLTSRSDVLTSYVFPGCIIEVA